jgi:hypothetical protein
MADTENKLLRLANARGVLAAVLILFKPIWAFLEFTHTAVWVVEAPHKLYTAFQNLPSVITWLPTIVGVAIVAYLVRPESVRKPTCEEMLEQKNAEAEQYRLALAQIRNMYSALPNGIACCSAVVKTSQIDLRSAIPVELTLFNALPYDLTPVSPIQRGFLDVQSRTGKKGAQSIFDEALMEAVIKLEHGKSEWKPLKYRVLTIEIRLTSTQKNKVLSCISESQKLSIGLSSCGYSFKPTNAVNASAFDVFPASVISLDTRLVHFSDYQNSNVALGVRID